MQVGKATESANGTRGAAANVEFVIGRAVEWAAGWLVVVEMGILFAGVISRYVFR